LKIGRAIYAGIEPRNKVWKKEKEFFMFHTSIDIGHTDRRQLWRGGHPSKVLNVIKYIKCGYCGLKGLRFVKGCPLPSEKHVNLTNCACATVLHVV
jgi:hypothetical protein